MSLTDTRQQRRARERAERKKSKRNRLPILAGLGAFALAGSASAATFTVTNLNDSGAGSLRDAVTQANSTGGADTINFQSGLTGTITLTTGEIPIIDSVTINGPGRNVITISGNNASRIFNINDGMGATIISANINNLTLTSGNTAGSGGAINSYGESLSLDNVVISGSSTGGNGGGIYWTGYGATNPTLSITNSTISGNSAIVNAESGDGGGLDALYAYASVTLSNDTFTNNIAGRNGGGANVQMGSGATLNVLNDVITNNTGGNTAALSGNGGGLRVRGSGGANVVVADSVISGNLADKNDTAPAGPDVSKGYGGGLYFYGDHFATVRRTTISGNTAWNGGGVYTRNNQVTFENVTIANNAAQSAVTPGLGGGVSIVDSPTSAQFNETTITNNTAQSGGGGINGNAGTTATLYNSIVANNTGGPNPDINSAGTVNATYTLIKTPGTTTIGGGTGNITGSDPNLGALADNGSTVLAGDPSGTQLHPQTKAQSTNSPVVDAGDPAFVGPPTSDERGAARIQNGRVDMGAVEIPPPTISIVAPAATNEGNSGTTPFVFTVTLSSASTNTVTVAYMTVDGTATSTAGAPGNPDYTAQSGTVTFTPGQTSKTITVNVNGDVVFEPNETFSVTLSSPTNATIATPTGTTTILNDDNQPSISINSPSQPEGNAGTSLMPFTVSLSAASTQTITVNYATADGTATAPSDYVATSGMLTFTPGQTTQTINVTINGDTTNEPNETFNVNLSSPTNATISNTMGTGTIQNDDAVPTVSIGNVSQNEGNSGTTPFDFTATLSQASAQVVTVNYATANGTATAPSDYTATSGTLTFNSGTTTQTITVNVNGDTTFEPDETFTVNLSSPSNATISAATGNGTIVNDDPGNADVGIVKTGPTSGFVGQNGTFNLAISNSGPNTASNVVVTDTLPAGMQLVSATPSQGTCGATTTVTCNLGAMNNGGTATVTLNVLFTSSGTSSNSASVTAAPQPDTNPANNASTAAPTTIAPVSNAPALSETMLMLLSGVLAALGAWIIGKKS